jgi:hypothetical protein
MDVVDEPAEPVGHASMMPPGLGRRRR